MASVEAVITEAGTLTVGDYLADWLAHGLLLARSVTAIEEREIRRAPELFMFNLQTRTDEAYELVDHVNEGGGRQLVVIAETLVAPAEGQLALPV